MKASKTVNAELNHVLGLELIAINQYFLHARMLKNWGFHSLAGTEMKASIDVMKEADELIERILFLEGLPNLQDLGKLRIATKATEVLDCDLALETALRAALLKATEHCERELDFVSRHLLTEIQETSEERIDYLETQLELVGKLGLENYLQSAASQPS